MRISENYILREIMGEYIVVPTGEEAMKFQGLVTLNETGAFLWKELQKSDLTKEELRDRLCEEYEVDEEMADQDLDEFLEHIRKYEVVLQEDENEKGK